MVDHAKDSSLEALKKQAKRWLKALRSGDAAARERFAAVFQRPPAAPGLREVQQALARERGFESWAALKEDHAVAALADRGQGALLAELLQNACIFSRGPLDFPQKWRRAERIRAKHPELARQGIHAAVVCGEVDRVRQLLAEDRALVHAKGGPQGWEPLLFLCYGRLPYPPAAEGAIAIAELLLDAGADPRAAFVHPDGEVRFSALCGVMGRGEMGAAEHPRARELAELLLDRGADPNESQGLYNTHLAYVGDDPTWLEVLVRRGLTKDAPVNWDAEPKASEKIFDYLLVQAAAQGHVRRLRFLLEHGANADARSRYNGKTSWQNAVLAGQTEIARALEEHGATVEPLEGRDAFVAAAAAGDRETATRLGEGHPEYLLDVEPLIDAARAGRIAIVELLLGLGMDPNRYGCHGHLALHEAASNRSVAELLLARGADPRARAYGGTAQRWASRAGDLEMARWHAKHSRSLLDAVGSGDVALVKELLASDPKCIEERSPRGDTPLHELPSDPDLAAQILELLLPLGADAKARNEDGRTPAEKLIANGQDDVADLLEVDGD